MQCSSLTGSWSVRLRLNTRKSRPLQWIHIFLGRWNVLKISDENDSDSNQTLLYLDSI